MEPRLSFVKNVKYVRVHYCRHAFSMIEYYDGRSSKYQWFICDCWGEILVTGTIHRDIHQCLDVIDVAETIIGKFTPDDGLHFNRIATTTASNGEQLADGDSIRELLRSEVPKRWVRS